MHLLFVQLEKNTTSSALLFILSISRVNLTHNEMIIWRSSSNGQSNRKQQNSMDIIVQHLWNRSAERWPFSCWMLRHSWVIHSGDVISTSRWWMSTKWRFKSKNHDRFIKKKIYQIITQTERKIASCYSDNAHHQIKIKLSHNRP